MVHRIALIAALCLFGIGMLMKVSAWFRHSVGLTGEEFTPSRRIAAALKGIASTLFSARVLRIIRVFFVEVIFQATVLHEDFLRWLMHICIYSGFMLLFVLHVLDNYLIAHLVSGYSSTLNPFPFLRSAAGALIVMGIILAIYRRFFRKTRRPMTSSMDVYAVVAVALIVLSGFLLEGAKITSNADFQRMVDDYTFQADPQDLRTLQSYWVENFGSVIPGVHGPFDAATLEAGKSVHEMSCAQCHSNPKWGFGAFLVSRVIKPVAPVLDAAGLVPFLTWAHYLLSLFFLAYLPFSKMFHIFASPLGLMVNAAMGENAHPANAATRQMLELDACTHCGACTLRCSVAVTVHEVPNVNILPSEKIASLRRLAAGKVLDEKEILTIRQGIVLCTNCDRCSIACPSGIRLRDLWFAARERLLKNAPNEPQLLSPLAYYRGLLKESFQGDDYRKPLVQALNRMVGTSESNRNEPLVTGEKEPLVQLNRSIQAHSFSNCYRCGMCTNSCPVVQNYSNPEEVLGLLPNQLMHAIGLRCWDLVYSSRMLWDCLGCYQCQDNCPERVSVTDILYELKNRAISRNRVEQVA